MILSGDTINAMIEALRPLQETPEVRRLLGALRRLRPGDRLILGRLDTEAYSPGIQWRAVITYSTDSGPLDVEHDLEELEDVPDRVEHGPHWDTITGIRIERARWSDGR